MGSPYEQMTKINNPGGITTTRSKQTERRNSRRCKITQLMRIRPSDPERDPFEDIRGTISVSRTGVYFHSSVPTYAVGMRLFVTMPYSKELSSMSHEYLAEVVRREPLPNGLFGVGFKILMEMGLQSGYGSAYSNNRR
jgi:hypothetical protein